MLNQPLYLQGQFSQCLRPVHQRAFAHGQSSEPTRSRTCLRIMLVAQWNHHLGRMIVGRVAWSLAFTLCRISYLSRGAGCISSTSARQATGRFKGHGPKRRWYLVHPAQLTQYTVTLTPATGKFITCECGCICQKQELRVSSPH